MQRVTKYECGILYVSRSSSARTLPLSMRLTVPTALVFVLHYMVVSVMSRQIQFLITLGPREQINQVTAFIDASTVYGSTTEEVNMVRLFEKGSHVY